ncbi:SseB family protein [Spirillospora sp. NPDC047279]|uniref:SseB family protein n=1 Tax=Spirillospora sp. NPDC047279 TaxID=3155478 RepID=UPI0033CC8AC3
MTEVWIPVQENGLPLVLGLGEHAAVLAMTSKRSLPGELPPGCVVWQRISLNQLAAILSGDVLVCLHPDGDVLGAEVLEQLSGRRLVRAAEHVRKGQTTLPELWTEFLESTVYCLAADEPGTVAYESDGRCTVPVFSSLLYMARTVGDVAWLSTTGRDLVAQMSGNYELRLDPGASYSVTLETDGEYSQG